MTFLASLVTQASLTLPEHAREALYCRGVTDSQASLYQVGYLNGLPDLDCPPDFLKWSQDGAKLRDVLVFPVTNVLGDVRGVQVRGVDRSGQGYTDYIPSLVEPAMFGLGQAAKALWATGQVWLVEGVYDLFPIQRHFEPTVATLTARVTKSTVRLLARLVNRIWLGYDMDAAGRQACTRFQRTYGSAFQVRVVSYPRVPLIGSDKFIKDPGDLWEVWGDDRVGTFVRSQLSLSPFEE